MNNLIAIAAPGPVGPTFLEWSIYYLSGQEQYFHVDHGWQTVTDNPLATGSAIYNNVEIDEYFRTKYTTGLINAHGHKKNVCFGSSQLKTLLDKIGSNTVGIMAWHMMLINYADAIHQSGLTAETLSSNCDLFKKELFDDYSRSIDYCLANDIKVVFLEVDPRINLYFLNDRRRKAKNPSGVVLIENNQQSFDEKEIQKDVLVLENIPQKKDKEFEQFKKNIYEL
jgi:hypothetical protein